MKTDRMSEETRYDEMRRQVTRFHEQYPAVWTLFCRFTQQAIDHGYKNYSVNAIFERIRWERDMGGDGVAQFKLNNNYRAFYARRFMKMYPEHNGFFRTRTQTSADESSSDLPELGPMDYAYEVARYNALRD